MKLTLLQISVLQKPLRWAKLKSKAPPPGKRKLAKVRGVPGGMATGQCDACKSGTFIYNSKLSQGFKTARSVASPGFKRQRVYISSYQEALAGEAKWRVFPIQCDTQRGLDLLHPDYTKERNKQERGHSFGFWRHSATKKKLAFRRIAVALSRHSRIAHCSARIYGRFISPIIAPWLLQWNNTLVFHPYPYHALRCTYCKYYGNQAQSTSSTYQ